MVGELDREAIAAALANPSEEWMTILRGAAPQPPVHGWLEYYLDTESLDRAPMEDETTGRYDYKNLKLFFNIEEGQPLVRKHDSVPGQSGVDVFGKTIPPEQAQSVTLPVGEGVRIEEDGYLAVAAESGAVSVSNGRLTVTKVFKVHDDTSYKTGNLDFNGTIDVGRDVLAGFSLRATGDIIVRGVVEAANIEAGGNIQIMGGFQGSKKGKLKAGGDIHARYANDGTLEAGGKIILKSYLLNCYVQAGEDIEIEGESGVLAGGEVWTGHSIKSAQIGTEAGVKTLLHVGLDQDLPAKIETAKEITLTLIKLRRPFEHRKAELEEMQKKLLIARDGKVSATKKMFSGVTITFPGSEHTVKDPTGKVIVSCVEGKIEVAQGAD